MVCAKMVVEGLGLCIRLVAAGPLARKGFSRIIRLIIWWICGFTHDGGSVVGDQDGSSDQGQAKCLGPGLGCLALGRGNQAPRLANSVTPGLGMSQTCAQ